MPQTSSIAAALIVGFIVFITVRGELSKYIAVLGIGTGSTAATPPAN